MSPKNSTFDNHVIHYYGLSVGIKIRIMDSVGDSEVDGDSSTNQQPVFYSWGYTFQYENNDDEKSKLHGKLYSI